MNFGLRKGLRVPTSPVATGPIRLADKDGPGGKQVNPHVHWVVAS
ncbi:MAG: hypothetical protein CM15mP130_1030 [Verrucomicrobiota bacterium]|nr:MAG: hypothetical protein CM15mP130_1030 [Verrucomicrobiota bacterium]